MRWPERRASAATIGPTFRVAPVTRVTPTFPHRGLAPPPNSLPIYTHCLWRPRYPVPTSLVGHSVGGLVARLYAPPIRKRWWAWCWLMPRMRTTGRGWRRRSDQCVAHGRCAVHAGRGGRSPGATRSRSHRRAGARGAGERPIAAHAVDRAHPYRTSDAATLLPGVSVAASERLWSEQQADLVTLCPKAGILAEGSGHYIQQTAPTCDRRDNGRGRGRA